MITCIIIIVLSIIFTVVIFAVIINGVEDYYKQEKNRSVNMSFREALDLTGIPVVTFNVADKKLNFLLDTGSDLSHINKPLLPLLDCEELTDTIDIIGAGGNIQSSGYCNITLVYKDQTFVDKFYINDLEEAFSYVKKETGVQIHGILGSAFFTKYQYILDFDNFIAYPKKKEKKEK